MSLLRELSLCSCLLLASRSLLSRSLGGLFYLLTLNRGDYFFVLIHMIVVGMALYSTWVKDKAIQCLIGWQFDLYFNFNRPP